MIDDRERLHELIASHPDAAAAVSFVLDELDGEYRVQQEIAAGHGDVPFAGGMRVARWKIGEVRNELGLVPDDWRWSR